MEISCPAHCPRALYSSQPLSHRRAKSHHRTKAIPPRGGFTTTEMNVMPIKRVARAGYLLVLALTVAAGLLLCAERTLAHTPTPTHPIVIAPAHPSPRANPRPAA